MISQLALRQIISRWTWELFQIETIASKLHYFEAKIKKIQEFLFQFMMQNVKLWSLQSKSVTFSNRKHMNIGQNINPTTSLKMFSQTGSVLQWCIHQIWAQFFKFPAVNLPVILSSSLSLLSYASHGHSNFLSFLI